MSSVAFLEIEGMPYVMVSIAITTFIVMFLGITLHFRKWACRPVECKHQGLQVYTLVPSAFL